MSARRALETVVEAIAAQESCGSAADHDGCFVAESLRIARNALQGLGDEPAAPELWRMTFVTGGRGAYIDIPAPLSTAQSIATALYELGMIVQYELHPLTVEPGEPG